MSEVHAGEWFQERARKFIKESEAAIGSREPWWYALKLAEERGEAIKAFNRSTGLARRKGTIDELAMELADVVMSAFILAEKLNIKMAPVVDASYRNVMSRGFRE